jgi:phosphoglycolate phosphatase-like HAD superfamily hydrolase
MVAFDLDGCLIDSEELIRQSYLDAGAEPPAGFLALGHHDWIAGDREAVHARKDAAYLRRLAADPLTLLAWRTAEMLQKAGRAVVLLTGAPEGTIQVLAKRMESWPFMAALAALSPAGKAVWLAGAGGGVYVDDQSYVRLPESWRFVQYAGQDACELYRQVACR